MKINFKNKAYHRSFIQNENKKYDFSKVPTPLFEEVLLCPLGKPIHVWAIPLMINDQTAIFGLFDGRIVRYDLQERSLTPLLRLKDRVYSSPLLIHKYNMMIVASDSGELAAIDTNTFSIIWHIQLARAIHSSPSFCDQLDSIFVGCYDNRIYAIHVKTGDIMMRQELELGVAEDPYSSPTLGGEQIFIGTGNKLISLRKSNLTKIWEQDLESFVDSSPAIDLNLEIGIVGTEAGRIILFSTSNGTILKEWETDSNITCSPSISTNGIACIGNDRGQAYGINLKTQEISWVTELESPFKYTALTCTPDNKFIFTLSNGYIVCLSDQQGEKLWQLFGTKGYHTPPLITKHGYLFCGSHFGYISGYRFSYD